MPDYWSDAIHKIHTLTREVETDANLLPLLCETLAGFSRASVVCAGRDGKILCASVPSGTILPLPTEGYIDERLLGAEGAKFLSIASPLGRLGTLFMYKNTSFTPDEIAIAETVCAMAALILKHERNDADAEDLRSTRVVKAALDTLSYSELNAVLRIFRTPGAEDGRIVAAKIADAAGLSRSSVITALRKLESAGIIETRSLGVKGTHIKVLNESLIRELSKIES